MTRPFSIGAALDDYDAQHHAQLEAERTESPRPDALDAYAATLTVSNHPPNECGDPAGCPIHSEQYLTYMTGKQEPR